MSFVLQSADPDTIKLVDLANHAQQRALALIKMTDELVPEEDEAQFRFLVLTMLLSNLTDGIEVKVLRTLPKGQRMMVMANLAADIIDREGLEGLTKLDPKFAQKIVDKAKKELTT